MKRIRLLIAILLVCALCSVAYASESSHDITRMSGIKSHIFTNKPFVVESMADTQLFMLPLRETMESLGYEVVWNTGGIIDVSKGYFKARLTVGKDEYYDRYNGKVDLYVVPTIKDGVTYVPYTFFVSVLNYDTFLNGDTVYIRSNIDGIYTRNFKNITTESTSDGTQYTKIIDVSFPNVLSKSNQSINEYIDKYLEELYKKYDFNSFNLVYDIAMSNKKILSIIFNGKIKSGDEVKFYFDTINFNLDKNETFGLGDFIRDTDLAKKFIMDKINKDGVNVNFSDLKFYLVKDAVIIYKPSEDKSKQVSKFFKLYELEHILSDEFMFLVNR
ncbi:MAG: copper amine oxidase N-terminal domain-containing protein [Firmicutes bacterium]|nr:copper amine oxidase N-terminal domain-containing protein [Bacillota bacterium]